jgi:hypothetical protein
MAIFQGDVFFRRIIEVILQDMRENPWLVDDALSDFVCDPILSGIYGQKEIENAKKWLKDNEISILLPHRMDMERMPCITVSVGSNQEDKSLARLADQTPFIDTYEASDIGKTISYIVKPFTYISYNQADGFFEVPTNVDLAIIRPGMVAIDPDTGVGYEILETIGNGFFVPENAEFNGTKVGILPQYRVFRARREIATFQERITIGCHAHGDPNVALWLHTFVLYGLLRYREGVLESRNFQLSNLENSDMVRNSAFENIGENVYSRFIVLSGQVEHTWVKAPKRIIESVNLTNPNYEGESGDTFRAGLVIIGRDGGEVPEIIDEDYETWVSKDTEE